MSSETVEIKQVSLGYNKIGVYVIYGEDGEMFQKMDESARTFKTPSAAVAFLRNACEKYRGLGFIAKLPNGKVSFLGKAKEDSLDEEVYGPHVWHKKNSVTIIDKTGGSYDVYMCEYCKKEEKSYGLSGHSLRSGTCIKNIK